MGQNTQDEILSFIFMLFAASCSASPVIRITECKGTFETTVKHAPDSYKDSKCMKVDPVHYTPTCTGFKLPEGFKPLPADFKLPEGAKLIPAKQLTKEEFMQMLK